MLGYRDPRHDPQAPLSADGRAWWDGAAWQPVPPPSAPPAAERRRVWPRVVRWAAGITLALLGLLFALDGMYSAASSRPISQVGTTTSGSMASLAACDSSKLSACLHLEGDARCYRLESSAAFKPKLGLLRQALGSQVSLLVDSRDTKPGSLNSSGCVTVYAITTPDGVRHVSPLGDSPVYLGLTRGQWVATTLFFLFFVVVGVVPNLVYDARS